MSCENCKCNDIQNMVEVEIDVTPELKEALITLALMYPMKSLNQLINEALVSFLDAEAKVSDGKPIC